MPFRHRPHSIAIIGLLLLLLGAAAIGVRGAPILPGGRRLSDEKRTLAGIRRLHLHVRELPREFSKLGLTQASLALRWRNRLEAADFEIVEDPAAPTLELTIIGGTDSKVPNGIAFAIAVRLLQRVHVERLDEQVVVPTYTDLMAGLESMDEVVASSEQVVDKVLLQFIRATEDANLHRERE